MTALVPFEDGAIQVDAAVVAKRPGIEPPLVQKGMREERITSLCERGLDDDEGLYRSTSFSESRRFRLTIDYKVSWSNALRLTLASEVFPRHGSQAHDDVA